VSGYRQETKVCYCILYEPQPDGEPCKETIYKVVVTNEHDWRSLYQEMLSMSYFRTRELKRAHPNKHRTIKWTSIYRDFEFEEYQQGYERCGIGRRPIFKEIGPSWYDYYNEVGYDKKRKQYIDP
jgi:hypothetical protein